MVKVKRKVAAKRYKSPEPAMKPHDRELFEIMQEEAAEVIQRASKALRFGLLEKEQGQKLTNRDRQSDEVGDLLCLVVMCEDYDLLDTKRIAKTMKAKRHKLKKYMQHDPD